MNPHRVPWTLDFSGGLRKDGFNYLVFHSLHTAGVGCSNPLPPTQKDDRKSGRCGQCPHPDFSCSAPDVATAPVQSSHHSADKLPIPTVHCLKMKIGALNPRDRASCCIQTEDLSLLSANPFSASIEAKIVPIHSLRRLAGTNLFSSPSVNIHRSIEQSIY